jgi:hypothetical protein
LILLCVSTLCSKRQKSSKALLERALAFVSTKTRPMPGFLRLG